MNTGATDGSRTAALRVTRIRRYPVKSLAGVDVARASVEPWGLAGDRRWGIVDPSGGPVTAREANAMLGLTAETAHDGRNGVRLDDGTSTLLVDAPTRAVPVEVGHERQGVARPAGPEADAWLTARLGRDVRLVWQPDPSIRSVAPEDGGLPDDRMSLADAGPLLLTSVASLAQLDAWSSDNTPPLDMVRFRPNIVIGGEGAVPFAEDDWTHVTIGDVRFRVAARCDRCVMTTIDPTTLARGKEPIRTLATYRRSNGKTWFGVFLVPELPALAAQSDGTASRPPAAPTIRVGDPVQPA